MSSMAAAVDLIRRLMEEGEVPASGLVRLTALALHQPRFLTVTMRQPAFRSVTVRQPSLRSVAVVA